MTGGDTRETQGSRVHVSAMAGKRGTVFKFGCST